MRKVVFSALALLIAFFTYSCTEDNMLTGNADGLDNTKKADKTLTDATMTLSPFKIILNAKGKDLTLQAIFGGPMPSGYHISSFDIDLSFNGVDVCEAIAFTYCYIDNNYFAVFDRYDILENAFVQSLAGTSPLVTAYGTYTITDGETYQTIEFSKFAYAEVEAPGR